MKLKSFCTLTGRGTPSRSHVKQNIVTPYAVSFDRPQCLIKFASNNPLTARTCASKSASAPVWKSKFYGAFVLNHRVVLDAIDATPARWRGDAGSSPLDETSAATSSPRSAPDTLVDFHTARHPSTSARRRTFHLSSWPSQRPRRPCATGSGACTDQCSRTAASLGTPRRTPATDRRRRRASSTFLVCRPCRPCPGGCTSSRSIGPRLCENQPVRRVH